MDYWEKRYQAEGMIWGAAPSPTAYHASDVFEKYDVKTVRNMTLFIALICCIYFYRVIEID